MENLELLWTRLEDAKLQWDHAHERVKEIKADKSSVPLADGDVARQKALEAEDMAATCYVRPLHDYQAALLHPSRHPVFPENCIQS